MNDNLRRRKAAFELRQRAADALDEASKLDGDPAMRLLLTDLRRIAEAAQRRNIPRVRQRRRPAPFA